MTDEMMKVIYRKKGYNGYIEAVRMAKNNPELPEKALNITKAVDDMVAMHIIALDEDDRAEVLVWPDGTWWWADELNEFPSYMGDDFFRMWFPLYMTDNGVDQEVHAYVSQMHKPKDEWMEV